MMDITVVAISVVAIFCVVTLVIIFLITLLFCLIVRHVDKVDLLCIFFLRKTWTYLEDMLVKLIGVQFIVLKMLILLTTCLLYTSDAADE